VHIIPIDFRRDVKVLYRVPTHLRADLHERKAWIARRRRADHDVLQAERTGTRAAAAAEPAAGLDRVIVLGFVQAAEHHASDCGREPVLYACLYAPAGRLLNAAAVDVDTIGLGTERDLIAGAEDRGADHIIAVAITVGTDAVVAGKADVVLVAVAERRVDPDTGYDSSAPRVAWMRAERGGRLRRARCAV
jgi:hypothetical protein